MVNREFKSNKLLGDFCPEIGNIHVAHDSSKLEKNGRYSLIEADTIAKWLADNIRFIEKKYARYNSRTGQYEYDIKTLIVITPFQSQKNLIKYILDLAAKKYCYPELMKIPCLSIYELLTMGEKNNIILFSTVYGSNEDWKFFWKSRDIIEVALLWAKDYFFVFGERNIPQSIRKTYDDINYFLDETRNFIPDNLEKSSIEAEHFSGDKQRAILDKELGAFLTEHLRGMGINVSTDMNEQKRKLDELRTMSKEEAKDIDGDFEVL